MALKNLFLNHKQKIFIYKNFYCQPRAKGLFLSVSERFLIRYKQKLLLLLSVSNSSNTFISESMEGGNTVLVSEGRMVGV